MPEPNDDDRDPDPELEPETTPIDHEPARLWMCAATELLIACRDHKRSEPTEDALDRLMCVALNRAVRMLRADITD